MLSDRTRAVLDKLNLDIQPVAVKFLLDPPEWAERTDKVQSLCMYMSEAVKEDRCICVTAENDSCVGKAFLGFEPIPPAEGSGALGVKLGAFYDCSANGRLYHLVPRLELGCHRCVVFCPLSKCEFDPDVIVVVCDMHQADKIMRANTYFSGDLWESKGNVVMSCAWELVYPFISGKINHMIAGMAFGQKMLKPFPEGMHIISIPFQKIREITDAMEAMPWEVAGESITEVMDNR